MPKISTLSLSTAATFLLSGLVTLTGSAAVPSEDTRASSTDAAEPLQERPKPPQAAFDACRSHAEGDACSVDFGGRTISGTCRKPPDGGDLICFPSGPPPGAPPGNPPS